MYLLSCKYTKLTWTQPKPGWAFCFLAWEAGTHFPHDAAEDWTVTEISLCLQSNMFGRCPEERLHWAVLLIPQGGARSVHLSRVLWWKSPAALVWFLWRGDLLAMKPPRLYLSWSLQDSGRRLQAGNHVCPDVSLSGVSPLETEFMFH